jgi:hypothetical protein
MKKIYKAPHINSLGSVQHLTANVNNPIYVDVPEGTPQDQGPIVGSDIS